MRSRNTTYRLRIAFTAIVLFGVLGSCKKSFLEIVPKGKAVAVTTNDYDQMLNALDLYNISSNAQVPLSDEVAASSANFVSATLRTQRLFQWADVVYQNGEDAPEMAVPMRNLYLYNTVINEVLNSTGGSTQQKLSIQAEAMADRAWTNFLLINYYGKPYSAATAATDPGFPIITEADATLNSFSRASVQEVYNFIIKDLVTAIPNLPTTYFRTRMSRAAAEGILGKVYVFMAKYSDALPLLNNSFADLSGSAVPIRLYDYNVDMKIGGVFALSASGVPPLILLPNILENIFARQFANIWNGGTSFELLLNPQAVSLYKSSDLRLAFFNDRTSAAAIPFPAGMKVRRSPSVTQIGFTMPDLYLLRAECKGRLNDLTGAKADLETLRAARMPAADVAVPANITSDRIALVKYILEERGREFAMQGYRWFDMRRLSIDPDYSGTVRSMHNIYDASGNIASSYTLKPQRLVLQFPQKVMDQNPGMVNNP